MSFPPAKPGRSRRSGQKAKHTTLVKAFLRREDEESSTPSRVEAPPCQSIQNSRSAAPSVEKPR